MPNWETIKAEYISGGISQREIAKKYGVSYNTLKDRANREGWKKTAQQIHNKVTSKLEKQAINDAVKSRQRFDNAVDMLLEKVITNADNWVVDTSTAQQFANTLQKIESMKHIDKSDLDKLEQQARIRKLQKEAEDDGNKEQEIRVILSDGLEDYAD